MPGPEPLVSRDGKGVQRLDPGGELALGHHRRVPALQVGQLPAGELGDRLRACRLGQEP